MGRQAFWQSVGYAIAGLTFALRTQRNLRWHLVAACAVLTVSRWLGLGRVELALLVVVIGLVLCAEVLNTAVELTIDMIKATEHPVARLVKDVSAAAVLVTVFMALAIGWLLILPHLSALRQQGGMAQGGMASR